MSTALAKSRRADWAGNVPGGDAVQLETRPFRWSRHADVADPPRSDRTGGRAGAVSAPRHLAWPDKAGLAIALIAAVMAAFACAIVLIAGETVAYDRLNHALALWAATAVLTTAGPLWLLMRAIDFLTGGPSRRRADRERHGNRCPVA